MIVDLILDSEVPNDDPYPFGKHVPYIPATVGITEEGFWLVPVERCKHGYLDPHPLSLAEWDGQADTCPGAGIGGDDAG